MTDHPESTVASEDAAMKLEGLSEEHFTGSRESSDLTDLSTADSSNAAEGPNGTPIYEPSESEVVESMYGHETDGRNMPAPDTYDEATTDPGTNDDIDSYDGEWNPRNPRQANTEVQPTPATAPSLRSNSNLQLPPTQIAHAGAIGKSNNETHSVVTFRGPAIRDKILSWIPAGHRASFSRPVLENAGSSRDSLINCNRRALDSGNHKGRLRTTARGSTNPTPQQGGEKVVPSQMASARKTSKSLPAMKSAQTAMKSAQKTGTSEALLTSPYGQAPLERSPRTVPQVDHILHSTPNRSAPASGTPTTTTNHGESNKRPRKNTTPSKAENSKPPATLPKGSTSQISEEEPIEEGTEIFRPYEETSKDVKIYFMTQNGKYLHWDPEEIGVKKMFSAWKEVFGGGSLPNEFSLKIQLINEDTLEVCEWRSCTKENCCLAFSEGFATDTLLDWIEKVTIAANLDVVKFGISMISYRPSLFKKRRVE